MNNETHYNDIGSVHHSLKNHIQTIFGLLEFHGISAQNESFKEGIDLALSKFFTMTSVLSCFEDQNKCSIQELLESFLNKKEISISKLEINSTMTFDVDQSMRLMIAINELFDFLDEKLKTVSITIDDKKIVFFCPECDIKEKPMVLNLVEVFISQLDGELLLSAEGNGLTINL